jgi:hypothetical protein
VDNISIDLGEVVVWTGVIWLRIRRALVKLVMSLLVP